MSTQPRRRPPPTTIGEAYPNVRRFEALKWIGFLLIVSFMFAVGLYTLRLIEIVADDPLYLARVPWRLPVRVLFDSYVSLIMVIREYTIMYLPGAPLTVEENLVLFGLCCVGGVALVMMATVLGIPVEDSRVVMACAGVLAILDVGLLVYWAWLVRKYGDKPVNTSARQ
uniref:DUF7378 domain-containing protein n=1 Tax=Leersia perrieri TaxID=77586 RepID=A0A0D9V541_9ORYZ